MTRADIMQQVAETGRDGLRAALVEEFATLDTIIETQLSVIKGLRADLEATATGEPAPGASTDPEEILP